jgi:hypothetical protein
MSWLMAWVQSFHDDLVADTAARSAAIMLPVLSTRFFESEYCQKEFKAFVEAHGATSSRSHQSRVMPVNLLCTAPAAHVLNEFQAITFFTEGGGVPFEHAPGTPPGVPPIGTILYL